MRFLASFLTTFVSFAFLGSVIARAHNSDASHRKRHGTGESLSTPILAWNGSTALEKRYDGVRFSFYDAGLGACGKRNGGSDFIVAMNHFQFDSGDYCFKTITINCEGKSAQAQIVDRCVECPFGALDFSRGLFDHFANEDRGYIYGSWTLGSGEEPKPSPSRTRRPQRKSHLPHLPLHQSPSRQLPQLPPKRFLLPSRPCHRPLYLLRPLLPPRALPAASPRLLPPLSRPMPFLK